MKFNYKLRRLCGSCYGSPGGSVSSKGGGVGSNLCYDSTGNNLVSAVSNRIQVVDLRHSMVRTLPVEARSDVRVLALSPDGCLLLAVDTRAYCQIINLARGIVMHRIRFGRSGSSGGIGAAGASGATTVRDISFSPDGRYVAVAVEKQVQVWMSAGRGVRRRATASALREVSPLVLHRTFVGFADAVTRASCWSRDSSVLVAAGREGCCRVFTLETTMGYTRPFTLAGHKRPVVGVFFCNGGDNKDEKNGNGNIVDDDENDDGALPQRIVSVSEDGAVAMWLCCHPRQARREPGVPSAAPVEAKGIEENDGEEEGEPFDTNANANEDKQDGESSFGVATSDDASLPAKRRRLDPDSQKKRLLMSHRIVGRIWRVEKRHYLGQQEEGTSSVSACSYCDVSGLLAVGFASGLFGLYEMPSLANLHTLSVGSGQLIKACALNSSGEWLALGCPQSQQLLVWEWKSETYVLKQRGHAHGMMRCVAYSQDGIVACTGGEDGKIKLWNTASGFCYVTLESTHTAPVTGVAFATSSVVLSSSLDGTVRAHDLHRYRTFRTFTSPKPTQFVSIASDPSGELAVAGSVDPFHVYCWNIQTGKLIDVLTGHSGPVTCLAFQPSGGMLVSGSWDGTAKVWDLYKHNIPTESLQHSGDVVCVAFRPDGRQLCVGTIGGVLSFWDVETSRLQCEIDGRKDISGGRKMNDRMAADNNASSRFFTSVCYSADGTCVLAGGNSRYVCIYEVSHQMLVKKFQVTHNRSLDGVLEELHSKQLGDFGPITAYDSDNDDDRVQGGAPSAATYRLPGARREDDGSRRSRVEVLTYQVCFSPTGREWAAVSGEGLHVYSLDDDMIFDPISLTEDITPASILGKLASQEYSRALHMALHLNEFAVVRQVLDGIPYGSIGWVVRNLRARDRELERLIHFLALILEETVHVQFYVEWSLQLLQARGSRMDRHENRGTYLRALRSLHKAIQSRAEELHSVCQANAYTLSVLQDQLLLLPPPADDDNNKEAKHPNR
jgi:periodic tryptophan protein 2